MAMNNWGGVKEHMTKKPRQFFKNKRASRKLDSNKNRGLTKEDLEVADSARSKSMRKEVLVLMLAFVLLLGLAFVLIGGMKIDN